MNELSLGQAAASLVKRDLLLSYRRRGEAVNPILFFVLVTSLFPLGTDANPTMLQAMGAGVIWVAALLAAMLSLDGMFRSDYEDGTLELMVISAHPLTVLVLAKVFAHWLVTGLPLLVISPLLALLLGLSGEATWVLMQTLLLGTPVLSLVGAIGVALTVAVRRGGVLLSLLILPLYVPVLIFASHAVGATLQDLPLEGQLHMLGAFLALALVLAPLPTAAALRISLS